MTFSSSCALAWLRGYKESGSSCKPSRSWAACLAAKFVLKLAGSPVHGLGGYGQPGTPYPLSLTMNTWKERVLCTIGSETTTTAESAGRLLWFTKSVSDNRKTTPRIFETPNSKPQERGASVLTQSICCSDREMSGFRPRRGGGFLKSARPSGNSKYSTWAFLARSRNFLKLPE